MVELGKLHAMLEDCIYSQKKIHFFSMASSFSMAFHGFQDVSLSLKLWSRF